MILEMLREKLWEYNKVFLVTHLSPQEEWRRICSMVSVLKKEAADNRLVILLEEGVHCPEDISYIVLSHEDAKELYQLYLTYDFSDKFFFLSGNLQYGTIFNYVDTGILSEEEAVTAILS